MVTKKQIEEALDTVLDPELGVSIVQMGLIYGIEIDPKGNVRIRHDPHDHGLSAV